MHPMNESRDDPPPFENVSAPEAVIYCDEAGNSGPNYVDPAQPFYVLAAWAVPYRAIPEAAAQVELHRQRYSAQVPELKSASLLRSERNKLGLVSLLDTLIRLRCIPFFVVAEKRFCIAGKIVETFLDPRDNPKVSEGFIPDTKTKQEFANTLYDKLTDDELNTFANAYRAPSPVALEAALDVVVAAVRSRVNAELAELLEGCRPQIEEIARIEAEETLIGKFGDTLNHPALAAIFVAVELAARAGLFRPLKFVHDESHAYQDGFKRLFAVLREPGSVKTAYPYGLMLEAPIRHLTEFETTQSKSNSLIQAADVLAGSIRHWAEIAIAGQRASPADVQLALRTVPSLLSDDPRTGSFVGSDKVLSSLCRHFLVPDIKAKLGPLAQTAESTTTPVPPDPAPLMPSVSVGKQPEQSTGYGLHFPIYALVGRETGFLYCVEREDLKERGGVATLLFHTEDSAQAWLEAAGAGPLTEPFQIRRFEERDGFELIDALRSVAELARTIIVFVTEAEQQFVDLPDLVRAADRAKERVGRAISSGMFEQIYEEHEVDGLKVASMLMSDGSYAAMLRPNGPLFSADSRQAAIGAVLAHAKSQAGQGGDATT
ncbi:MAG: DUF3800 domain-containing protein [Planctomycetota bacterium]